MTDDFRGTGWKFPIAPDASGALSYVSGDENIEQSLYITLLTQIGERVMRPGFGCKAGRMVFKPGSEQNLRLLEVTVKEAVRDWEPRITLDQVLAEAELSDPTRVSVSIHYTVRRTNTRQNLVFPFYLGTASEP